MTRNKPVTEEDLYEIEQGIKSAFGNPKVHYHWVHEDVQRLIQTIRALWEKESQQRDEIRALKNRLDG